jgi:hypothetical protein
MPRFVFTTNGPEFQRMLNSKRPRLAKAAKKGLQIFGEEWVSALKQRNTGRPGTIPRGGDLRSSIMSDTRGSTLDNLALDLWVGGRTAHYAHLQEEGGTIKPVNARMLTIPIGEALTGGGAFRDRAKIRPAGKTSGGKPKYTTGYGDTNLFRSKAGNLVITAGRKGSSVLLYVLKDSVKIPPRLGAHSTLLAVGKESGPKLSRALLRVFLEEGA